MNKTYGKSSKMNSMRNSESVPLISRTDLLPDQMSVPDASEGNTHYVYSSISPQVESRHRNPIQVPFPRATRVPLPPLTHGPGPGDYVAPSSIGKEVSSKNVTEPGYTIPGKYRYGSAFDDDSKKKEPGPSEYRLIDLNTIKKKDSSYSIIFRHKEPASREVKPAPGEYILPSTLEKKAHIIGTATRQPLYNEACCKLGPGEYKVYSSIGKMIESKQETIPVISFTKDSRFKQKKPESVQLHTKPLTCLGKQVVSKFKTGPSATMSGRTKFGSYFGW